MSDDKKEENNNPRFGYDYDYDFIRQSTLCDNDVYELKCAFAEWENCKISHHMIQSRENSQNER